MSENNYNNKNRFSGNSKPSGGYKGNKPNPNRNSSAYRGNRRTNFGNRPTDVNGEYSREGNSSNSSRPSLNNGRSRDSSRQGSPNKGYTRDAQGKRVFNNQNSTPKRFGSNEYREKKPAFDAICADCGCKCDLPFKPTQGKPVYCRECFKKQQD